MPSVPQVLHQLLHTRHLTEQRTRESGVQLAEAVLCLGDVPMLLRQIRRAAKLGATAALESDISPQELARQPAALPPEAFEMHDLIGSRRGSSMYNEVLRTSQVQHLQAEVNLGASGRFDAALQAFNDRVGADDAAGGAVVELSGGVAASGPSSGHLSV